MKSDRRKRILEFNRRRAADREKADDLAVLLGAMPPGQVKQLLKNKTCAAILKKHGSTEV